MQRHIQTIFCDDIRHELGGKVSFIGVYSARLIVPAFPVTLPKLCVAVNAVTPAAQPFERLTLRVLKDDELLFEAVFDEKQLAETVESAVDENQNHHDSVLALGAHVVMSPFQIGGPCRLRVRAETEEGELRGLSLIVEQAQAGGAQ
ncbi:DUF6941 family protein [Aromatoleum bremense]|uniref:Uncharacterized protein n=1 Tax=Aromatoleum bremense TaxID=76115 RepID=A0ABX1NY50_9RHOO|nr:hypothetical protein [Aromatoleum bremense]NMG16963.1 hypothetical protein [Aromatoleum bremense]QTQ33244.1 Uncharacterized protein pbN1_32580 [Aromatoleum bremense]